MSTERSDRGEFARLGPAGDRLRVNSEESRDLRRREQRLGVRATGGHGVSSSVLLTGGNHVLSAVLVDQLLADAQDDDVALLLSRHPAEVAAAG